MGKLPEPKVGIIIPSYHAEKTLGKALDSVLAQTYPNWEVFLIDDASKDGSAAVAQQYAAQDSRIHFCRNEKNSGASATRNRGLEMAADMDYLAFLDSDDWWDPVMLEHMVNTAEQNHADFVQCGWTLEWPNGNSLPEDNIFPELRVFDRAEFAVPLKKMLTGISMNHTARKLVRGDLIRGLKFSEKLVTAEDLAMCFALMMRAERIAFLPEPLYHYYRDGSGLTSMALSFRRKWDANVTVSNIMLEGFKGTPFDTWYYRTLARLRPFSLIVSKAVRLVRDKLNMK